MTWRPGRRSSMRNFSATFSGSRRSGRRACTALTGSLLRRWKLSTPERCGGPTSASASTERSWPSLNSTDLVSNRQTLVRVPLSRLWRARHRAEYSPMALPLTSRMGHPLLAAVPHQMGVPVVTMSRRLVSGTTSSAFCIGLEWPARGTMQSPPQREACSGGGTPCLGSRLTRRLNRCPRLGGLRRSLRLGVHSAAIPPRLPCAWHRRRRPLLGKGSGRRLCSLGAYGPRRAPHLEAAASPCRRRTR